MAETFVKVPFYAMGSFVRAEVGLRGYSPVMWTIAYR